MKMSLRSPNSYSSGNDVHQNHEQEQFLNVSEPSEKPTNNQCKICFDIFKQIIKLTILILVIFLLILGCSYLIVLLRDQLNESENKFYVEKGLTFSHNETKRVRVDSQNVGKQTKVWYDDPTTTTSSKIFNEYLMFNETNFQNESVSYENNETDINWKRRQLIRTMALESFQTIREQTNSIKWIALASTLNVMELNNELKSIQEQIKYRFHFENILQDLDVTVVVTDIIGGLLSCYALTGDQTFIDQAMNVAHKIEPAYQNIHELPYETINPLKMKANGHWQFRSKIAAQLLEYAYLAAITQDPLAGRRRSKIRSLLSYQTTEIFDIDDMRKEGKMNNLPQFQTSLYYTNYIKQMLNSLTLNEAELYKLVKNVFHLEALRSSSVESGNLLFAPDYPKSMYSSSCNLGAILALVWNVTQQFELKYQMKPSLRQLAINLTETCHLAMNQTETGLIPKRFDFDDVDNATNSKKDNRKSNDLSPELAETYFVLWRLTGDEQYREYAWNMAKAIHKHGRYCDFKLSGRVGSKKDCSYFAINDVDQISKFGENRQLANVRFLSGTLKYLYLTFVDDKEKMFPLNQWIFNIAGHPLPICGHNDIYPEESVQIGCL